MLKNDEKIILHLNSTTSPQFLRTAPHGLWSTRNLQEFTTIRMGAA
jgi:hypothetical protein